MIIETEDKQLAFEDRYISAVEFYTDHHTLLYVAGTTTAIKAHIKYKDALELFKKAQSRDKFSDQPPSKSEQKKFEPVIVGAHKFKIDIRTTEYEDGASSTLHLYTNFELKGEELKEVIKSVEGISDSLMYGYSRYETSISIGKMFDAEWVRQNLENNLIMYLQA